jgi:hypothetical protein
MKFTNISSAKKSTGLSYIGSVNSSAKIVKNKKYNVMTYIVYLAPANQSGYNTCPKATDGCRMACLNESGHNKIGSLTDTGYTKISNSRITKTKLFFEQRDFFVTWLVAEIYKAYTDAKNKGFEFSVRFNGTSDINIETVKTANGLNILQIFPDVQFYDYTKVFNRLPLTKKYVNYHLTFSYSGANMSECLLALSDGYNVAMVFNNALPSDFMGYKVVNADDSDLRYLDESGVICGLKYKKVRNKNANINNSFVINL